MICNQNHQNCPNATHNIKFSRLGGGHIEKGAQKGCRWGKFDTLHFSLH